MREIKFRAWDKTDNIILKVVTGMHIAVCFENPKRFVLMQYTSLKDKNGKEIYEGDIVKSTKEFNSYTGMNSELYGGGIYKVKNEGWRFYLEPQSIYSVDLKELEVIGNIYENPELIEHAR